MKVTKSNIRTKLIALVALLFNLLMVATLFVVPPADGYEPSLYDAYPWFFWVFVLGAFFMGQLAIFRSARSGYDGDRSWVFGLASLFIVNAVLIFMPYIRGYALYGRSDVMTHLGYIHHITADGVVGSGNIYPNMHILVRILAFATGLEPSQVINLLPPIFSMVYFGAMYLLVVRLFDDRSMVLFALAFVAIPVGGASHVLAVPYTISVLFVPFFLYLFVKEQQTNALTVRVALLVSLVAIIIYHPLTTLFLLAIFGLYYGIKLTRYFDDEHLGPTNVVSLSLAIFTAWYYNFAGIIYRFETILNVFLSQSGGDSTLQQYSSTVTETQPALLDLVKVGMFKYGTSGIEAALGLAFVVLALYLWRQDLFRPNIYTAFITIVFLAFVGVSVPFFVADLIVGVGRPLVFARITGTILAGLLFYLVWRFVGSSEDRLGIDVSMYAVVLFLVYLSVFSLYWSPLMSRTNNQVTDMELDGSEWLFEHRNQEMLINNFGINHGRFYDKEFGPYERPDTIRRSGALPPAHFNYTENPKLGQNYQQDTYLLLTQKGRVTYPAKFPGYESHWSFTPQDFDRVETDPSVTQFYTNGEFDGYYVDSVPTNGTAQTSTNETSSANAGNNTATTQTPTPTPEPTATARATSEPTATATQTSQSTPTQTPESTPTQTSESTPTQTPELTPTQTPEPTPTPTATPTTTPDSDSDGSDINGTAADPL